MKPDNSENNDKMDEFKEHIKLASRVGILIVIAGPSGVGKTAVSHMLINEMGLDESISYTTRKKRDNEVDGEHYFFVDEKQFLELIGNETFVEFEKVHGDWYGTPKLPIKEAIKNGKDLLFVLDRNGAFSIKRHFHHAVTIYMLPPSMQELRKRLLERSGSSENAKLELRLKNAETEVLGWGDFDYIVVNKDMTETANTVKAIIQAERHKTHLYKGEI